MFVFDRMYRQNNDKNSCQKSLVTISSHFSGVQNNTAKVDLLEKDEPVVPCFVSLSSTRNGVLLHPNIVYSIVPALYSVERKQTSADV